MRYWEWRTYKHQQGSLVWKPKHKSVVRFWMWRFKQPLNGIDPFIFCSFKVID